MWWKIHSTANGVVSVFAAAEGEGRESERASEAGPSGIVKMFRFIFMCVYILKRKILISLLFVAPLRHRSGPFVLLDFLLGWPAACWGLGSRAFMLPPK